MFIVSLKANKKRMLLVLGAAVLAVTLVLAAVKLGRSVTDIDPFDCRAGTNEERLAFLHQFGWEAGSEPAEINDVNIPQTFDDVYLKYNELQKSQGLDLLPYAGKACKQYVYLVSNYPGEERVRAVLLVLNGKVVGGDLSSSALDGFMCGFYGQTGDGGHSLLNSSSPDSPGVQGEDTSSASVPESGKEGSASSEAASAGTESGNPDASQVSSQEASSEIPANAWPTD